MPVGHPAAVGHSYGPNTRFFGQVIRALRLDAAPQDRRAYRGRGSHVINHAACLPHSYLYLCLFRSQEKKKLTRDVERFEAFEVMRVMR